MSTTLIVLLVVVVLVVLAVVGFIASFNKFGKQRNVVDESWRQVDVELQRRHDLIGNLVEVTKAAAKFEQATLVQVTQARAQAMAAHGAGPAEQARAEQALNSVMRDFFAVAEAYPTLTANQDFVLLQQQMVGCEDRIAAGRRFYNSNVRAYNTRFDTFPSSLVAGAGKFVRKDYFEVDDPQVRAAPSLRGAFDSLSDQVTPTPPLGKSVPPVQLQSPPSGAPPQ